MTKIEHARVAGLVLTGLVLLAVACVYAQGSVWPVAALLGVGAIVCADAALNAGEKARELHAAANRAELPTGAQLTPAEAALSGELSARLRKALDEAEPEIPDSMGNLNGAWLHSAQQAADRGAAPGWQEADQ
ncbi:hypothetical protein ABT071_13790 [Streptomyces sp. NPDC002506]|uniref:hypothetical protein n=1 Tax=Streptomyces sp. NPDC002506 TaxID=3154536 RepID=UPI003327EDE1